jgi:hypothetical protein
MSVVKVACRGNRDGGSAQARAEPKQNRNAENNETTDFVFIAVLLGCDFAVLLSRPGLVNNPYDAAILQSGHRIKFHKRMLSICAAVSIATTIL